MNKFHVVLCSKKAPGKNPSYSKVNIEGIKEIEEILPSEKDITLWARETVIKLINGQEADLIHVKIKLSDFDKIVKELYKKLGKSVELWKQDTFLYRIPTKKKNAFFEEIERIVLISDELRAATIVIHV